MRLLFVCAVLACAGAQYVKSGVKGGYGGRGFQQNAGESMVRIFGNGTQHGYTSGQNQTIQRQNEVGVCYIQVPTASLVNDPSHIPVGNGSRPDLSEVRRCCSGYIRNIHNHMICDPVCTKECVNALCTAPEICTCFPEHVKNLAGFCIPTCPIGCQNGYCAGGECICNEGYKLDSESKFCVPICRENCGGSGNCTAPNTCVCGPSYQTTPEGSCKPVCQGCANGDCVAPNNCLCYPGYAKDRRGECVTQCPQGCGPNEECVGPNKCNYSPNAVSPQRPPNQSSSQPGYGHHGTPYNAPNPFSNSTSPHNIPRYPYPYNINHPSNPDQSQHPNNLHPNNQQVSYVANPSNQSPSRPDSDNQLGSYPSSQTNPLNQPSNPQNQPNYPNNNQPNTLPNPPNYPPHQGTSIPQGNNPYSSYQGPGHNVPDLSNPYNKSLTEHSHYPNQPLNPNQPQYPSNQPQYPHNQPLNPNQPNYPSNQPLNPNQPNIPNQPLNPNQPQYPQNQPLNPNQPNIPNQPLNPNQPNYSSNQPQYPSNQPNQSQYPNAPQYPNQPRYPGQSQYPFMVPGIPGIYPYSHQGPNHQYPYDESHLQVPECSQPCINGVCVLGNRCTCNPGYVVDDTDPTGSRCKPHCAGGCHNGVCSGPNFCICNMGYYKDTGVKGRAMCVKRIRRSADPSIGSKKPQSIADLLVFEIPTDF